MSTSTETPMLAWERVQAYLVAASIPLLSDDKIQALLRATGGT